MKREFILKNFLIQGMRRLSYKWPGRSSAMANARISRGVYCCAICEEEFGRRDVVVDHKRPVISISRGFEDWNAYISRLFCDVSNLQVLCRACHNSKSYLEKQLRKQFKEERKEILDINKGI